MGHRSLKQGKECWGAERVAGAGLVEIFEDPQHHRLRQQIILMWRDMRYRKAVSVLVELLWEHDRFWSEQKLQPEWWNDDVASELTNRRRDTYGEVYYGVCTLRALKDPEARDVLKATLKRWQEIEGDAPRADQVGGTIVEECEAALRELPKP